jgi:hypothetical protein
MFKILITSNILLVALVILLSFVIYENPNNLAKIKFVILDRENQKEEYERQKSKIDQYIINNIQCDSSIEELRKRNLLPKLQMSEINLVPEYIKLNPKNPNGDIAIVIHGLDSRPELTVSDNLNYMSNIATRLQKRGYLVIVPYVFEDRTWILQRSLLAEMTDESFIAIISKLVSNSLDEVYDPNSRVLVYGVSWGSIVARHYSYLDSRVGLVVSSHFIGDPLSYIKEKGQLPKSIEFGFQIPTYANLSECNAGEISSYVYASEKPLIIESGKKDRHVYKTQLLADSLGQNIHYVLTNQDHVVDKSDIILDYIEVLEW